MKFGMLIDWFDSVGVEIQMVLTSPECWSCTIEDLNDTIRTYDEYDSETRPQARVKAIEKGNEIYNNRV